MIAGRQSVNKRARGATGVTAVIPRRRACRHLQLVEVRFAVPVRFEVPVVFEFENQGSLIGDLDRRRDGELALV